MRRKIVIAVFSIILILSTGLPQAYLNLLKEDSQTAGIRRMLQGKWIQVKRGNRQAAKGDGEFIFNKITLISTASGKSSTYLYQLHKDRKSSLITLRSGLIYRIVSLDSDTLKFTMERKHMGAVDVVLAYKHVADGD